MTTLPVRARILLVFEEATPLTRRAALDSAKVNDYNEFRHLVDGDYLRATEWKPNWPREYVLTPRGIDKRDQHKAVMQLVS